MISVPPLTVYAISTLTLTVFKVIDLVQIFSQKISEHLSTFQLCLTPRKTVFDQQSLCIFWEPKYFQTPDFTLLEGGYIFGSVPPPPCEDCLY